MLDNLALSRLWDFSDPPGSLARLRTAREAASDPDDQSEYTTQVARALGLQSLWDSAAAELDSVTSTAPQVHARVLLERGRLANSAGDPVTAIPLFHQAVNVAARSGLTYLQVDALHMLAIADPEHAGDWAEQGIALAEDGDDQTRIWLIALNNNRGWDYYDEGRFGIARQYFEQAKEVADQVGTQRQRQLAMEALAECDAAARAASHSSELDHDEFT